MKKLRILLVDDHEVVRRGLNALLGGNPEWEIVGEASSGREGIAKTKELKPEVVIMDISMPEMSGLEATRKILETLPKTKVLFLSMHMSDLLAREVLKVGGRGYVLKSDVAGELVAAVEALSKDRIFFSAGIRKRASDDAAKSVA